MGVAQPPHRNYHHKETTNAEANANGLEAELAKHGLTWKNVLAVVTDTEPTMNSAGLLFIQRAKDVGNDNLDHIGCVDHILNICTKKVALDPKIAVGPQVENAPFKTLESARGLCTTFSKSTQLMGQLLASHLAMLALRLPIIRQVSCRRMQKRLFTFA